MEIYPNVTNIKTGKPAKDYGFYPSTVGSKSHRGAQDELNRQAKRILNLMRPDKGTPKS